VGPRRRWEDEGAGTERTAPEAREKKETEAVAWAGPAGRARSQGRGRECDGGAPGAADRAEAGEVERVVKVAGDEADQVAEKG